VVNAVRLETFKFVIKLVEQFKSCRLTKALISILGKALEEQFKVVNAVSPEVFKEVNKGLAEQLNEVKLVNPEAFKAAIIAFELQVKLVNAEFPVTAKVVNSGLLEQLNDVKLGKFVAVKEGKTALLLTSIFNNPVQPVI
jgi:hypothetical protein